MLNPTEAQIEAAAKAMQKYYQDAVNLNLNTIPTRDVNFPWSGYARVALEAAWKVWWEGVARRSPLHETVDNNS